jgi:hypothetical protein
MKTLLINGCSFGYIWNPNPDFISGLDCDKVVNISKPGTSFQRTCRSTVEWIAQNGSPRFVVIPITFCHRWEMPIGKDTRFDKIDGDWIPIQSSKAMSENNHHGINLKYNIDKVRKLSDLYHGLVNSTIGYWDRLFTEIIMLGAFFDHRKIPYLMWDMCNDFDEQLLIDHPHITKAQILKQNKRIINIFSFCGNKYMWRAKAMHKKKQFNQHHDANEYRTLEQYLITYIQQNELFK